MQYSATVEWQMILYDKLQPNSCIVQSIDGKESAVYETRRRKTIVPQLLNTWHMPFLLVMKKAALKCVMRMGIPGLHKRWWPCCMILKYLLSIIISKRFSKTASCKRTQVRKFLITADDGKGYNANHHSFEMIIAVGFKVNSERAVQFRKWVNQIAKDYTIKGWAMDNERIKRGTYLTDKYFSEQLERIREIRASERMFYQKIQIFMLRQSTMTRTPPLQNAFMRQYRTKCTLPFTDTLQRNWLLNGQMPKRIVWDLLPGRCLHWQNQEKWCFHCQKLSFRVWNETIKSHGHIISWLCRKHDSATHPTYYAGLGKTLEQFHLDVWIRAA